MVRVSDLQQRGCRFQTGLILGRSFHVITLSKLFAHMCLCSPTSLNWKPVTRQLGPLTRAVNSGSGNKVGAKQALHATH